MKRIVLASRNQGKIGELRALLADTGVEIYSLNDYPTLPDVMEDGRSFLENALKKAKFASARTGETVLADDSGLEVDYLSGRPGIFSARYSGTDATDEKNIRKLLQEMEGAPDEVRSGRFRCVLALSHPDGRYHIFEGVLEGKIAFKPAGKGGFGYDPVFFVPEFNMTVAEMPPDLKNRISHRGKALQALKSCLQDIQGREGDIGA